MTVPHNRMVALLALVALVFMLPLIVFLVRSRQEIRPRALLGSANFRLSASTSNVNAGDTFNVTVSLSITNTSVRASGVDFTLLYDNSKLQLVNVTPIFGTAWTDAPVNTGLTNVLYQSEGLGQYNFIRMALVSRNATANLPGNTVSLASITFRALTNTSGQALIKFPADQTKLQVVGSGI